MSAPDIEHLLRRAGFGARPDELALYSGMTLDEAVDALLDYDAIPDTVDSHIAQPGYVSTTIRGAFSPQSNIVDSRQRWLFRMVHTDRPLQEKMTLFWHNHFATGYTKIAGALGATEGARYLAAKASEDPGKVRGQIEMLRDNALGNFQRHPREHREGHGDARLAGRADQHRESAAGEFRARDSGALHRRRRALHRAGRVCRRARVHRLESDAARIGGRRIAALRVRVQRGRARDDGAKTFSFPIYSDGSNTIPARPPAAGMQDGLDLIAGLAAHPNTGDVISRTKLYKFFVCEAGDP